MPRRKYLLDAGDAETYCVGSLRNGYITSNAGNPGNRINFNEENEIDRLQASKCFGAEEHH